MIGKNIAEIRKKRGYTLSELAELANISKSYLSNIERNINKNPSHPGHEQACNCFKRRSSNIIENWNRLGYTSVFRKRMGRPFKRIKRAWDRKGSGTTLQNLD